MRPLLVARLAVAAAGLDTLMPGSQLDAGEHLVSASGKARLEMQASDGNLVLYGNGNAVWSAKTSGHPGAYLRFQGSDGNLVLYDGKNALWASRPQSGAAKVVLRDNCDLLTEDSSGATLWSLGTSCGSPSPTPSPSPPPAPTPAPSPSGGYNGTIYLVRHAESPIKDRANYMTGIFCQDCKFLAPMSVIAGHISGSGSSGGRCAQTVQKVADSLGIKVDTSIDSEDYKGFAQLALRDLVYGTVLAAWRSENWVNLCQTIGGTSCSKVSGFDEVVVFEFESGQVVKNYVAHQGFKDEDFEELANTMVAV